MLRSLPAGAAVTDYRGKLILPGLRRHARPLRADGHHRVVRRAAPRVAREVHVSRGSAGSAIRTTRARWRSSSCAELLRNGTTTAMVFATTHRRRSTRSSRPRARRSMRLIAGKVLMDRNVPEAVRDTAESGYEESKALIARVARPRPARLRGDAAFRPDLDRAAARALRAPPRRAPRRVPAIARRGKPRRSRVGGRALPVEPQLSRRLRPLRPAARARRLRALHPSRRRGPASGWPPRAPRCRSARRRTCSSAADSSTCGRRTLQACAWASAPTSAAARASRCCARSTSRTRSASSAGSRCRRCRRSISRRWAAPPRSISMTRIGSFDAGKEADFVVLDPAATPHLARRIERAHDARRATVRVHDHGRRPRRARHARPRARASTPGLRVGATGARSGWNRTLLARHADVLVTMDDARREIADGALFVRGNRIERVGRTDELPAYGRHGDRSRRARRCCPVSSTPITTCSRRSPASCRRRRTASSSAG